MAQYLPAVELEWPVGAEVNASVIWLHGLGADGNDFAPLARQLDLPIPMGVRFVFPHAPSIPVTINNGYVMPAWYDILSMDGSRHVDVSQIEHSAGRVHDLIEREIERGVQASRILLAGFSQGGAVAYQAALTFPDRLAGIVALSTYFPTEHSIKVDQVQTNLPILICHGSLDPVVAEALGLAAKEALERRNFQPEYKSYVMEHQVCPEEVTDINEFFKKILL